MVVASHFRLTRDPFSPFVDPADAFDSRPYRAGLEQIRWLLRHDVPLVMIIGEAGSGKTMLLRAIERCCSAEGVAVRRLERGDLATKSSGDECDLLLIDEADKIDDDTLDALTADTDGARKPPVILASVRPCLDHLSQFVPCTTIEMTRLDRIEAALYLIDRVERAGAADLFTPEALDVIVDAADGSIQLLRVLGSNALFQATLDEAPFVEAKHAHQAAAQHGRPKRPLRSPVRPQAPAPTNLPCNEALPAEERGQRAGLRPAPPSAPLPSGPAFVESEAAWPNRQPIELRWTGVKRNDAKIACAPELLLQTPIREDGGSPVELTLSDRHPVAADLTDVGEEHEPDWKAVVPAKSRGSIPVIVAGEITVAVIACMLIWFAETAPSYAPDADPRAGWDASRDQLPIALDPFGIVAKEPSVEPRAVAAPVESAAVEPPASLSSTVGDSKAAPQPASAPVRTAERGTDRKMAEDRPQPRSLVASAAPTRCRPKTDSGCASPRVYVPRSETRLPPTAAVPRTVTPNVVPNVAVVSLRTEIGAVDVDQPIVAGDGATPNAAIDPATVMEAEAAREQARMIREAAMAARDSVRFARMGRGGG